MIMIDVYKQNDCNASRAVSSRYYFSHFCYSDTNCMSVNFTWLNHTSNQEVRVNSRGVRALQQQYFPLYDDEWASIQIHAHLNPIFETQNFNESNNNRFIFYSAMPEEMEVDPPLEETPMEVDEMRRRDDQDGDRDGKGLCCRSIMHPSKQITHFEKHSVGKAYLTSNEYKLQTTHCKAESYLQLL